MKIDDLVFSLEYYKLNDLKKTIERKILFKSVNTAYSES